MARDISKTMQSVKSLFFIGIGGISMSGFAELLHDNGFNVCGSDMKESKITKQKEASQQRSFFFYRFMLPLFDTCLFCV